MAKTRASATNPNQAWSSCLLPRTITRDESPSPSPDHGGEEKETLTITIKKPREGRPRKPQASGDEAERQPAPSGRQTAKSTGRGGRRGTGSRKASATTKRNPSLSPTPTRSQAHQDSTPLAGDEKEVQRITKSFISNEADDVHRHSETSEDEGSDQDKYCEIDTSLKVKELQAARARRESQQLRRWLASPLTMAITMKPSMGKLNVSPKSPSPQKPRHPSASKPVVEITMTPRGRQQRRTKSESNITHLTPTKRGKAAQLRPQAEDSDDDIMSEFELEAAGGAEDAMDIDDEDSNPDALYVLSPDHTTNGTPSKKLASKMSSIKMKDRTPSTSSTPTKKRNVKNVSHKKGPLLNQVQVCVNPDHDLSEVKVERLVLPKPLDMQKLKDKASKSVPHELWGVQQSIDRSTTIANIRHGLPDFENDGKTYMVNYIHPLHVSPTSRLLTSKHYPTVHPTIFYKTLANTGDGMKVFNIGCADPKFFKKVSKFKANSYYLCFDNLALGNNIAIGYAVGMVIRAHTENNGEFQFGATSLYGKGIHLELLGKADNARLGPFVLRAMDYQEATIATGETALLKNDELVSQGCFWAHSALHNPERASTMTPRPKRSISGPVPKSIHLSSDEDDEEVGSSSRSVRQSDPIKDLSDTVKSYHSPDATYPVWDATAHFQKEDRVESYLLNQPQLLPRCLPGEGGEPLQPHDLAVVYFTCNSYSSKSGSDDKPSIGFNLCGAVKIASHVLVEEST
ncbi:uncharacterized protein BXZ73DRAFT_98783 [Epithele typhae]|uniref:uncharacterized protein n=1 Tax=Epithele typhae TaxID=378194 RepID=UPI0020083D8C|nr:uncharacterized protein BXZ73DRAFT_98783 [Epithele typhae]KAH9940343.1 hypothetical protein BXZ73DRAFT_98783 [Epithele typhae]